MLQLFNSLSGRKEAFVPSSTPVTMYVCGVTPYDTTHVGHAYTYVVFDVLQRYLRVQGHPVRYVSNITDVDDSILERARQRKVDYRELGAQQTAQFVQDMGNLNVLAPDVRPMASEEIPHMVAIVKRMLDAGAAYATDGWVYFSIRAFPDYGQLGKLGRDEMLHISAERGSDPNDPRKRDALDFVLWQPSLDDEPSWPAPWGAGRPGWHLECTAMALRYLGESIDVHGGGADLIYPHHESEIAQSELYTGTKPFARFWVHTGMVRYQGQKMSKSLGNLVLARDLLRDFSMPAVRLCLLSHHYRDGWDFEDDGMAAYHALAKRLEAIPTTGDGQPSPEDPFWGAMDDDLDTPAALRHLEERLQQAEAGDPRAAAALGTYRQTLGI
ncbi:MAG TPA: cysteine--tRNA ligase [Chloroflexota bacterium]|jgi:L-cysteine:1D-myo-inositol 2-amino-2-deoxy-alpha-D-glucopyranoside ligase